MDSMEKNWNGEEEIEIDLKALIGVLAVKWWAIIICALLTGALALSLTMWFIAPKYESTAMLYVLNKLTEETSLSDIQIGTELTADFEVIAKSKPVVDGAIRRIKEKYGDTFTREDIDRMLNVSNYSGTRILVISVKAENAVNACMVANAVAQETAERMAEITKAEPPTTVEEAEISEYPVSPNLLKNTAAGFLAGLLAACAYLTMRFVLNDNIKTEDDVEKYLGLTTLAVVCYPEEKGKGL